MFDSAGTSSVLIYSLMLMYTVKFRSHTTVDVAMLYLPPAVNIFL